MKIGQTVNLYDPKSGDRQDAEILAITGAGDSRAKILTVQAGERKVEKVKHATDAMGGDPFWMVKGEESAPRGWAKTKKGEPVLAAPEPEPTIEPEG